MHRTSDLSDLKTTLSDTYLGSVLPTVTDAETSTTHLEHPPGHVTVPATKPHHQWGDVGRILLVPALRCLGVVDHPPGHAGPGVGGYSVDQDSVATPLGRGLND